MVQMHLTEYQLSSQGRLRITQGRRRTCPFVRRIAQGYQPIGAGLGHPTAHEQTLPALQTTMHKPTARMIPVGILIPLSDELFLTCVTSKVTRDSLVDVLEQWWQSVRERFENVRTLVINLDNGPENQSHRTQFLNRLVSFAQTYQLTIKLAFYPPYHSTYNPVERCWGIVETTGMGIS